MTSYPQYRKQAVLKVVTLLKDDHALVELDVYDVLAAFQITNPAQQHAIKKILRAGIFAEELLDAAMHAMGIKKFLHEKSHSVHMALNEQ